MDKLSILKSLADWNSKTTYAIDIVADTKNICYTVQTRTSEKFFLKVFLRNTAALTEYRLLNYLTIVLQNYRLTRPHLSTPRVLGYIRIDERNSAIISEFVQGKTAKDILLNDRSNAWQTCKQLAISTAQIHHFISAYADDIFPETGISRFFNQSSDCKPRLHTIIATEADFIFSREDTMILEDYLSSYWELLFKEAFGFPCDYYKDANPANWIVTADSTLTAVDFETQRTLPFFVDFINIAEYAADYLTSEEKKELLNIYFKERIALDAQWRNIAGNFDIALLTQLFALYRHQEQLIHRVRDLKMNSKNKWHKDAYFFHLDKMQMHLSGLRARLAGEAKVVRDLEHVVVIYQSRFIAAFAN